MTVHYGYNYKKDIVKKMQQHYSKELEALATHRANQLQLDEAQNLILDFFEDIKVAFTDVSLVSNGEVSYEENVNGHFLKMKVHQASIQFSRNDDVIEIELTNWNEQEKFLESRVVAFIIPGDKKCRLRRVGKVHDGSSFDESAINSYVRQVFAHLLDDNA